MYKQNLKFRVSLAGGYIVVIAFRIKLVTLGSQPLTRGAIRRSTCSQQAAQRHVLKEQPQLIDRVNSLIRRRKEVEYARMLALKRDRMTSNRMSAELSSVTHRPTGEIRTREGSSVCPCGAQLGEVKC